MDEMSAGLAGLAMLFGLATGRAWGGRNTERVLLNQCEYLRENLGRATNQPYTTPPGGGKSAAKLVDWTGFGARKEDAA